MVKIHGYEIVFRKLYPMYRKLIGRDGQAVFEDRRRSQYLARDELDAIQLRKLKRVLVNAADHVAYYREEFCRIGFVPADLTSLEELRTIDFFIDKAIVRDNVQAFLADNCVDSDLNWHKTGGSTGIRSLSTDESRAAPEHGVARTQFQTPPVQCLHDR